jgi:hypothetical protein
VKLLTNEARRGYFPGSVLGEEEFFREIGNFAFEENPEGLIELLRSHQVTHLLIREIEKGLSPTAASLLARIVDFCQNSGSDQLVLLSDYRFSLPSGSIVRYRLYFLPPIEKNVRNHSTSSALTLPPVYPLCREKIGLKSDPLGLARLVLELSRPEPASKFLPAYSNWRPI